MAPLGQPRPRLLLSLLKLCPRLRDLILSSVFVDAVTPFHAFCDLPSLSSLQIITRRRDISQAHLLALLSCFCSVDRLNVFLDREDEYLVKEPVLNGPLQLAMRSLVPNFMPEDDFFARIRSSGSAHTLVSLDIAGLAPGIYSVVQLQGLLEDVAPTLQRLRIELGPTGVEYGAYYAWH